MQYTGLSTDSAIMLRYNEIALKGGNRAWFEKKLLANTLKMIAPALNGAKPKSQILRGRILIHTPLTPAIHQGLQHTFGLSGYSPTTLVPTDLNQIIRAAITLFAESIKRHGIPESFRVLTRRSDKAIDLESPEIDMRIGEALLQEFPFLKVKLKNPARTLGVEIRRDQSLIWLDRYSAPGGLPVGANAPMLVLLSGGIDSPVAAIQMLKRGARVSCIHFSGEPFIGLDARIKVETLVKQIQKFSPYPVRLNVIPFGKIQEKIALNSPARLRTVLYRRLMIRIAQALAKEVGALALVTGESLGQVASQTAENLTTVDQCADMTILRPLIAFDKDEIMALAEKWGTFATSIQPAVDCCTLFADRHPELKCTPEELTQIESRFPIEDWVIASVDGVFSREGSKSRDPANSEALPTSAP